MDRASGLKHEDIYLESKTAAKKQPLGAGKPRVGKPRDKRAEAPGRCLRMVRDRVRTRSQESPV